MEVLAILAMTLAVALVVYRLYQGGRWGARKLDQYREHRALQGLPAPGQTSSAAHSDAAARYAESQRAEGHRIATKEAMALPSGFRVEGLSWVSSATDFFVRTCERIPADNNWKVSVAGLVGEATREAENRYPADPERSKLYAMYLGGCSAWALQYMLPASGSEAAFDLLEGIRAWAESSPESEAETASAAGTTDIRDDAAIAVRAGESTKQMAASYIGREELRSGETWQPRTDAGFVASIRARYNESGPTTETVDAVIVDVHKEEVAHGFTNGLAWITSHQAVVVLESLAKLDGAIAEDAHTLLAHFALRHRGSWG